MTISADDVRRLLEADAPDAVLVLIQGRTAVIPATELETDEYRGALQVATRSDLGRSGGDRGADLSDHELEEEAAKLEAAVANLGG
ncbi:hypothetical protein [Mycolicibacterium smegmatis]|jgi:hypothetical protein|uniref:FAD-dependent pyridine nucleotide-disulfide oxidoreductase n=1 Tax=Mycolicibacterium smegmatis (strain MKD8) TaxID=1214915 RepID=A0A2U9PM14_MYCSE|nr:hypothetical protein [Mycolicibacterium smegmatis]AWT52757.1 hypothetical protein D806_017730 [Mycolicibacterium smegmatis MKD8]MCP2623366.1 hypothetical protein [Mycolicibacterium smegmatis]MDF1902920.1 hypothetical protein [Mycolicibacterium smegmatis]MDF1909195.1 hypothetical protein [Mycolicibacterium smegmatis]MDF1921374.1 hypothetical protein [Mycolicibacterium smegmatis]